MDVIIRPGVGGFEACEAVAFRGPGKCQAGWSHTWTHMTCLCGLRRPRWLLSTLCGPWHAYGKIRRSESKQSTALGQQEQAVAMKTDALRIPV